MNQLLDLKAVADRTSCSIYTVRAWIRQGKMRPTRLGRRVLVSTEELERFIREAESKDNVLIPTVA